MLLVIDAGNSNVTMGVFRGSDLLAQWRLITDREQSSDEYSAEVRKHLELSRLDLKEIDGIAIASVVPSVNPSLTGMVEVLFGLTPLFVDHTTDTGLKILYDSPSELGADRIVDAVAAIARYGAPCIVVDFGTATTFNAISSQGEFLGGAISPGLFTCADALYERAAKLPRVEFERPTRAIGKSTVQAIQSGLYFGYSGLIDRVIEEILEGMGGRPRIIATGGLANLLRDASEYIDTVDETLTLDGLRLVYERTLNGSQTTL
jgi:type III pantothenate kinase